MAGKPRRITTVTGSRACAFCSGWYQGGEQGVVRSLPPCEAFRLLEVDVYMTVCRLAWQRLRSRLPPLHAQGGSDAAS